ncbi:MAG TPA: hypothetical protein VK611_22125, partial [Acidimicrobiales bacterium]|nr:hypothetical protein [Acidimicrobiales bacterium]
MERRTFIVGAAALPSIASIDGLDSIAPTDPPARVGTTEIAQIRDAAVSVKRGDMRWGGGFGFDAEATAPAHVAPLHGDGGVAYLRDLGGAYP